jgi:hypothetical protein
MIACAFAICCGMVAPFIMDPELGPKSLMNKRTKTQHIIVPAKIKIFAANGDDAIVTRSGVAVE